MGKNVRETESSEDAWHATVCNEGCGPEYHRMCMGCFFARKQEFERMHRELRDLRAVAEAVSRLIEANDGGKGRTDIAWRDVRKTHDAWRGLR